jgi:hypothetical protein
MCKKIRGIDYCMPNRADVCGTKWCEVLVPKIVAAC